MSNLALTEVLTPEIRDQIKANAADFAIQINSALREFGVTFTPGFSMSKMVKESPKYQALDKKGQTEFFNKVKSACKAYKLGEAMTVEAVINQNYWVRLNGTLATKEGKLKQINVSLMRPDIKASKLDDELARDARQNQLDARNDALVKLLRENGVSDSEIANATQAKATVVTE